MLDEFFSPNRLPSVVFGVEQEVSAHNCHTNGDNDQDENDEKHKSIDVVDLVGPEGCEYKVPRKADCWRAIL